jgi:hypothetical protein
VDLPIPSTNASIYHSNININKIPFLSLLQVVKPLSHGHSQDQTVIFYRSRSRETHEEYSHPLSYTYMQLCIKEPTKQHNPQKDQCSTISFSFVVALLLVQEIFNELL